MNGLPENQETSTQTSLLTHLKEKKVWLPGIGLLLLVAIIIAVRVGKLPLRPTIPQPNALPKSTETRINKQDFPDVVRIEETLPESLKENPKTKQIVLDGKTYIREQAKVKQVLIPGQSYLLTTSDKNEIISLINDQTLLADAWFGFDQFEGLTNIQYVTISKDDLKRVKEEDIVQIMYLKDSIVNQNIILTEFVLME